ncbi:dihydroneopterin aldolase [Dysgonomonas sp. 216]|uniref:dihydroneopterin aldolase n=1 Tax=Dysgonomonas sp. 216 TaxID=2302934 RepID=UPI0013D66ADB|nr:dihydroneopterin aldolase [Dysgonomonas sp. 216]NDW17418.1 dihydroneopterin aldolase [Dysgonomonas sp. 216]
METFILLENITFHANHGVFPQENTVGNTFIINLKIKTLSNNAYSSDDLNETLNYAEVYNIIDEEMKVASKLMEHVGGRIIKRLKSYSQQIDSIELKISKQNPPVGGQVEYASIILID